MNGFEPGDRTPDPERLLGAYFHSASTLNYIRALLSSSFADLSTPSSWSFSHVRSPALQREFSDVMDRLSDALGFMHTIGADLGGSTEGVEIFTSHEGLSLEYEECMTRLMNVPVGKEEKKKALVEEKTRRRREGSRSGSVVPVRNPVEEKKAYFNTGSSLTFLVLCGRRGSDPCLFFRVALPLDWRSNPPDRWFVLGLIIYCFPFANSNTLQAAMSSTSEDSKTQ